MLKLLANFRNEPPYEIQVTEADFESAQDFEKVRRNWELHKINALSEKRKEEMKREAAREDARMLKEEEMMRKKLERERKAAAYKALYEGMLLLTSIRGSINKF